MHLRKLNQLAAFTAVCGLLALHSASAQEAVMGYIKTASADATVVVNGQTLPAKPGMALETGSVLKTGHTGNLGITLKDNTRMSIGPDTELVIDDYLFAPAQDQLKLGARITKGSLVYISGTIAKLRPQAVSIKTPTGMIGVRGTELAVRVDPADAP